MLSIAASGRAAVDVTELRLGRDAIPRQALYDGLETINFLRTLQPQGPWALAAIDPNSGNIVCKTASAADADDAREFLRTQGGQGWNVYFQINLVRADLGHLRASKGDMRAALGVHAEIDPPKGIDLAALEAWQAMTADKLLSHTYWIELGLPRPSLILFSGSGFQLIWLLADPVALVDTAAIESIESRNRGVRDLVGADAGTWNVDRLLRLPHTLNYPGAKKRAAYGRSGPVPAEVIEIDTTRRYRFDEFPSSAPRLVADLDVVHVEPSERVSLDRLAELVRQEQLRRLIADGAALGADRSRVLYGVVCELVRLYLDDPTIAAIIGDPQYAISAHVLDQSDPQRAVDRVISRARADVQNQRGVTRLPGILARDYHGTPGALVRAVDEVDEIYREAGLPRVEIGLPELERRVGGFRAGTLTTTIGPPGYGKTSLYLQIAAHCAERGPVIYWSGELTRAQLLARVVSQRAHVPWIDVLDGNFPRGRAKETLAPLDLYVIDGGDPVACLAAALDRLPTGGAMPVWFVDYVQIGSAANAEIRQNVMGVMRGLRDLAREQQTVGFALAQPNRPGARSLRTGKGDAAATVDLGGESGSIEQDSANVLALSFEMNDGQKIHDGRLIIAKARYQGPSTMGIRFHGASGRFEELDTIPDTEEDTERKAAIYAEVIRHETRACTCAPQQKLSRSALFGAADKKPHGTGIRKESGLKLVKQMIKVGRLGDDDKRGLHSRGIGRPPNQSLPPGEVSG